MGLSDSPTSHGSTLLVSSSQPGRCSEGEGDDPPLDPRLDENNDLKRIGTDASNCEEPPTPSRATAPCVGAPFHH